MSSVLRRYLVTVVAGFAFIALLVSPQYVNLESATASSRPHSSILLTSGDHAESLTWDGLTRTYIVHVPSGTPEPGRSLILVYHGAGATDTSTLEGTDFEQAADQANDVVVFLQGYDDTWNELTGHTPAAQAHIDDIGFTSAVLNALRPLTGYNVNRVAATGLSNGAVFVETLGCHLASRLHLIVPVEGELAMVINPTCAPSRPVNVLEIHGTADPSIPYGGGTYLGEGGTVTVLSAPNSAHRWAIFDHCGMEPQTVSTESIITTQYSHCRSSVTVTLRTIVGGLHVWGTNIGQLVTTALGR